MAYFLNFFVRFLGKITRINHDLDKDFKKIAICKFKGMGSIIQATPMIGAIRKAHPNARIIFVSTKSNQKFLEKIDWIDEIVCVDDSGFFKFIGSNFRAIFKLMGIRPEVYFDLELYADYSTLFTLFTLSKNRVGFYLRSSSYRMGIYTQMMFFNPRVPISHVYLQMAQLICKDEASKELFSLKSNQPPRSEEYIIINPNASDLRIERRWSRDNFIQLIQNIVSKHPGLKILLVGSNGEKEYTDGITKETNNDNVISTAGETNLDELIGLIQHARLMISNDTGPMHIAFSTNTPVICLFGPCSPDQYGTSENAHIIYKKIYCSPCVHDFEIPPCKGDNTCMKLIETQEVLNKFERLMGDKETKGNAQASDYHFKEGDKTLGLVKRS